MANISQNLLHMPTSKTKELIVKAFSNQGGVQLADFKVSLRCPYSRQIMKKPVRSKHCTHLQCFDYDSYISFNNVKLFNRIRKVWKCPICQNAAPFPVIRVDNYFLGILRRAPNAQEIELFADGSWKCVPNAHGPRTNVTKKSRKETKKRSLEQTGQSATTLDMLNISQSFRNIRKSVDDLEENIFEKFMRTREGKSKRPPVITLGDSSDSSDEEGPFSDVWEGSGEEGPFSEGSSVAMCSSSSEASDDDDSSYEPPTPCRI